MGAGNLDSRTIDLKDGMKTIMNMQATQVPIRKPMNKKISQHGNVGNKNAAKPETEKLTQARVQMTTTSELKDQCTEAARLEGISLVAWIRKAMEEKLKRIPQNEYPSD